MLVGSRGDGRLRGRTGWWFVRRDEGREKKREGRLREKREESQFKRQRRGNEAILVFDTYLHRLSKL